MLKPVFQFDLGLNSKKLSKSLPGLKLQDLTFGDISLYVDGKLAQNEKVMAFRDQEPAKGACFVREIITRADGVFLWVKLVVKSLLDGLNNEDSIADFDRRLHELPSDLEDLYTFMFNSISSRHFVERSQILQIMRATNNWRPKGMSSGAELRLCALTLSFAIEDTEERALSLPNTPISSTEVTKRVERIDKRLKVCCAGLLELFESTPIYKIELEMLHEDAPVLEIFSNTRIKYLHKTAKDFLDSNPILTKIQQATLGTGFSVWSSLLKSFLLRLKTCEPQNQCLGDFLTIQEMPMEIAYMVQSEENTSNVRLLDEIGRSISHLRPGPPDYVGKDRIYENFNTTWPDDFLALATKYSLSTYLAVKLATPNIESSCTSGRSYLYHAFNLLGLLGTVLGGERSVGIVSNHTVDLLLQYSNRADISAVWTTALAHIATSGYVFAQRDKAIVWINIIKLFLEYGADPGLRVMRPSRRQGVNDSEYSVSDLLGRISGEYPTAAAEVYRMVDRRHRFLYRIGLLKPKKTPDPQKWQFRKDPE